jgi:hypothetical protein
MIFYLNINKFIKIAAKNKVIGLALDNSHYLNTKLTTNYTKKLNLL